MVGTEGRMTIYIERLDKDLPLPSRAHKTDAGIDLYSTETFRLLPDQRVLVPAGIKVSIPQGHVGMVCPRSGLAAKKGITVLNAPGIIDQGYLGEVKVNLVNTTGKFQMIERGDRIAQLVVVPVVLEEVLEAGLMIGVTERGESGHGSTGE